MKKILIIDESLLFREYLTKKLIDNGFEAVYAINGFDGNLKIRSEVPDLIIIDYYLSRKSSVEILKEKMENPNTKNIPVIMVSAALNKTELLNIAKFKISKFFSKPVKMDSLLRSVSEILNEEVKIDSTPCIIEAHFNEDILFIEIAMGLNEEKIELLKYKIKELMDVYEVKVAKVLLMLSNVNFETPDKNKFISLIDVIMKYCNTKESYIKILTKSLIVKDFLKPHPNYKTIDIYGNLELAMDKLVGIKADSIAHDEIVQEKLLTTSKPKKQMKESIELRFQEERTIDQLNELSKIRGNLKIAIVDDDLVIHEIVKNSFLGTNWKTICFNNGKEFIDATETADTFNLIYLDLMMPEMNGFEVLNILKKRNSKTPIVVMSALTKKETVMKAMNYGIKTYMIKPLKPKMLTKKALDILNREF